MPGLKEITKIQEEIKKLGNEKEVADELELLIKTSPEQLDIKESESDKAENLIDNVLDHFDEEISDNENFDAIPGDEENESTEDFLANLVAANEEAEKTSQVDNEEKITSEIPPSNDTTEESTNDQFSNLDINEDTMGISETSSDDTQDFLSNMVGEDGALGGDDEIPIHTSDSIGNISDNDLTDLEQPIKEETHEDISMDVSDELSDLAGDFGDSLSLDETESLTDNEIDKSEIETSPETNAGEDIDVEELSTLETLDTLGSIDEPSESDKTSSSGPPNDLEDLEVIEGSEIEDTKEIENVLEEIGKEEESDANVSELDSLLATEKGELSNLDDELGDFSDLGLDVSKDETSTTIDNVSSELSNESIEALGEGKDTKLPDELSSGLEEISEDELLEPDAKELATTDEEGLEDTSFGEELDEFGIDNLGDLDVDFSSDLSTSEGDSEEISDLGQLEETGKEFKDFSTGEVPEEISETDLSEDQDVDVELSDEERRQIIISLSSLPKKAELTISNAIVSNKYSNKKLKPLIDALISNEKPGDIIHIYQTITGDKSLANILTYKYTGEEFDKKQKSFIYTFQKNILPILSRIAVSAIALLAIVLIFVRLIFPTLDASKNYKIGRRHIIEKKFSDVDQYFSKAFRIQPRFNEVIKYARLYRKYKRYKETEKKYALALTMKPYNKPTRLELADFYREKGDFERASKIYNGFLKINYRDIPVLLGLGQTLMDWSNINKAKLDQAEQIYLDILDINRRNKDALFGNLAIQLKRKNYKKIMQYYNYINKKLKNNINPYVYADLAKYFIDRGETKNIKDIIKKAYKMELKQKDIIPQIDYQNSRYLKMLDVSKEEKKYLNNTLLKLQRMKTSPKYQEKYESKKYQQLLARVHNALGENYNRTSKDNIKAEEEFILAKEIDPTFGKPYFNLGNFALFSRDDRVQALFYYKKSEEKGYKDDTLEYNLGWLYYKKKDFYKTYNKISNLLDKYPYNSNLKFMLATDLYKLKKYQLAESLFLENYIHFNDLVEQLYPLDMENKDSIIILEMLKKIANNLGATFQKRYELNGQNKLLVKATKYYSESLLYFDKLNDNDDKLKDKANQNLRMVLYPDIPKDEPFIFENFTKNYRDSK